jgi:hypothetical protein
MVKRTVVSCSVADACGCEELPLRSSLGFPVEPVETGSHLGPMYLPVDCPGPEFKTIVKTWQCKIEGPAPACGPAACGAADCGPRLKAGLCDAVANLLGLPFDALFAGCDGVYDCGLGGLGGGGDGPCGPGYGPLSCVMAGVPMALGAPSTMFGALW